MANINQPRGLEPVMSPYGSIKKTQYRVYNSCASNLFVGDPVAREAGGTVTIATAGANNKVLGAITDIFDSTGKPVTYYPATADNYKVCVADDPGQEFIMQEDGATSDLALTDEGLNVNLVAGSGSTTTGLSGWQLDSNSNGVSASIQMRLVRQVQDPINAVGDYCRWIVKINNHQALQGIVGAGI
jgi:hypothetical protein